jgi:ribonuclease HI
MRIDPPAVIIYTDGACNPNPGPGGWAAILTAKSQEKILTGSDPKTTNNRMELTAAIEGLKALKHPTTVCIYTDSEYLRRGITEWLPGWQARNWKRKAGELANVDLWKMLANLCKTHQIEWKWLRGHAGHPMNERVDLLAREASRKASS